ncbi:hypothetical protein B0I35DRAFT_16727 [Stachybotrys elegans]|uniref:Uncharacterized protein n=1 Tax=Stachybotrys elegans TaxID=80388 RepID=A0A8K0T181_9HYPO|nr:hypothetical protein B0I35DRAFT_16727 [Stachybotrys elegans]
MRPDSRTGRHDAAQDPDSMRGRKRDRSMTRTNVRSLRTEESSTLRGRSPRRATSPVGYASRHATPSLLSPTRHLLLQNRLHFARQSRREHCPSRSIRVPEARALSPRRYRSRSRSRGPRSVALADVDIHTHHHRTHELLSSLRNEVRVDEEKPAAEQEL